LPVIHTEKSAAVSEESHTTISREINRNGPKYPGVTTGTGITIHIQQPSNGVINPGIIAAKIKASWLITLNQKFALIGPLRSFPPA
jgi:hypothetical protein